MDSMEVLGIPYFIFQDIPQENSVLLRIYADRIQFKELHFEINDGKVSIFSSKYPDYHIALIRLPKEIKKSESKIVFDDEQAFRCYRIILQKSEDYSEINSADFDVISPFLSWKCNYLEEPLTFSIFLPNSEDDLSKSLLKKLTLKESVEKTEVGLYGFASRCKDELKNSELNWRNCIDCDNPDSSDQKTRFCARWENERQSFDIDHYLADYFFETDDEVSSYELLYEYLIYQPYWEKIKPNEKILTLSQMSILAGLPCKNFNLSPTERLEVLHSLFDIILAYAYDCRINSGMLGSESSWNISKLSSTLSWLQVHKHPRDVIISFFRRSLTFPLMRHFALSRKVLQDALVIFHLGRRQLLNCLVSIYELFDEDDSKIFNELYVEDYLIWIQQVHSKTIKNYTDLIESCELVHKGDVFSTLPSIESTAIEVLQEDQLQYKEWCRRSKEVNSLIFNKSSRCTKCLLYLSSQLGASFCCASSNHRELNS